jgi:predicted PurR-regulated permease PerM
VFLAVPLLAVLKIVCDRVEPLRPVGHVIGS